MFNIFVHSRLSIENVKTDKVFSLISIIEPIDTRIVTNDWQKSHVSFPSMMANKTNCFSSLCSRFYDTDKVIEIEEGLIISPIADDQAKIIALFANNCFENNIEELYVNCAAGISRSAGVAAAISKFYTGEDDFFYKKYIPNRYVYMRVLEALYNIS